MDLNEYQELSRKTAIYPVLFMNDSKKPYAYYPEQNRMGFLYPALGLAGEAGEVLENIKRIIRDDEGRITPGRREKIKKECGDTLWYLAQVAIEFNLSLTEIAEENLQKLNIRLKEGKIQGEGDNR